MPRKIDGGVCGDGDPLIRKGRIRQSKLAAIGKSLSNITAYLGIAIGTDAGGSNRVFVVLFIIRKLRVGRLRGTLGLRVIGGRVCCNGIFARTILGIVTILVFGIPASSVAYISRLT